MERRQVICDFCHLSEESPSTGPLLTKNNVVVHENCLLFSSGIYSKNTPDVDDLCGIDYEDIIKEIKRGKKLKCFKCKKSGATIGCELPRCKKSYHFPCAMQDKARKIENLPEGIFRLYCRAHRRTLDEESQELKKGRALGNVEIIKTLTESASDNSGTYDSEELTDIERVDQTEDLEEEIPSKRTKMSSPKSNARKPRVGRLDSSSSSDSGGRQEFASEQGPVETDVEDDANPGQNVAVEPHSNSDDLDNTQLDRNVEANEPQPSTSGNQVTSNGKSTDPDVDTDQCSESLLLPFKIIQVESLSALSPDCSHDTQVPSVEFLFWTKCQEAGCIQSIFSTFISSVKELSERMIAKQASEDDCILSFKVLKASGMLPDILAQIGQDMNGKLKTLQEEMASLQTALSAIGSASKLCSSNETIKHETPQN